MRRWILAAALGVLWATETPAQALLALEPPLPVRDGRLSASAEQHGLSLGAELAVRDADETAKVLPQLRSGLAVSRLFNVEARVGLPDLNGDLAAARANVDTRLRVRPRIPLIRGVDTRIRRAANGTSTDTSIAFEPPAAFLSQLEGRIRETPRGDSTYSFTFGFRSAGWSGDKGNGRFSSEAILEQTERAGRDDGRRIGFQTVLAGSRRQAPEGTPFRRGAEAYKLALGVEQRSAGSREWTAASLALKQSWLVHPSATVGLSMKLAQDGAATRKSLEIAWQAAF